MRYWLVLFAITMSWTYALGQYHIGDEEYIYGKSCGWGAEVLKMRTRMDLLVEGRDTTELSQWLWSKDPALMCYGVEGLRKLQASGTSLNARQSARIVALEQSKLPVTTCKGCFIELRTMKEALADPMIRSY